MKTDIVDFFKTFLGRNAEVMETESGGYKWAVDLGTHLGYIWEGEEFDDKDDAYEWYSASYRECLKVLERAANETK